MRKPSRRVSQVCSDILAVSKEPEDIKLTWFSALEKLNVSEVTEVLAFPAVRAAIQKALD